MADVVGAAIRRARQTWPQREIVTKIAPAIPPVAGDAALLEQLVFNLLDNANKYSSPESPTTVSIAEQNGQIVLFIEDEGPGIAKDELERVFEKFYRVKGGDGRSPGTGLGLAICRGITNAMGGSIQAESPVSKGRGTRLVVRFPKMASP